MDAEDITREEHALEKALRGKKTEIDPAKVDADVAAARALAAGGDRAGAVERLLAVEKAGRLAEDIGSTQKACAAIIEVLHAAGDWKGLEEHVVLLSKRRGQLKQAVTAMVRQAAALLPGAPDAATRESLLVALKDLTEGKIYVELERARLTRQLAAMREAEGRVADAAEVLQEVAVETFGAMAKTEKIHYILEQVRLCLERGDVPRAQILARKVSPRAFAPRPGKRGEATGEIGIEGTAIEAPADGTPTLDELKLAYYGLMVRLHGHAGEYVDMARCWRAVLDTPAVAADAGRALEALVAAAWYCVLAPAGADRDTLLALTAADGRLEAAPAVAALLAKFGGREVMWWKAVEAEAAPAMAAAPAVFGGPDGDARRADFRARVTEHNVAACARYYSRMSLARLGQVLGLEPAAAEAALADMVTKRGLDARIDRPAGIVAFAAARAGPRAALDEWAGGVARVLAAVEKSCQAIHKEAQVHRVVLPA